MSTSSGHGKVSSPFATGGGGSAFEAKIQAGLLVSLLVRAHVPGFGTATITELSLQAEHAGFATDDAVLIANHASGQRKQLWSVKHQVKFTEKDEVFRDVLQDAWSDFQNSSIFNPSRDVLILATSLLPSTYKHFLTLLEIVRATSSFSDFEAKIARPGFIAKEAKDYFDLLVTLGEQLAPTKPDRSMTWNFLRSFHVLGFDFDQMASKDEARFKSLLSLAIRAGTGETGEDLWNQIFKWAVENNPRAARLTYDSLPEDWKRDTTSIAVHFESGAVERLLEHGKLTLRRVRSKIGAEFQLPRSEVVGVLATAFSDETITLVSGEAGVGKSAATVMALQQVTAGDPFFVFQAKEFARQHLDQVLADMRVRESFQQISSLFGLYRRKFILLESVERLLEASERDAFADLLTELASDPTWRIVLTCRHHAVNLVKDTFLSPYGFHALHVIVPRLTAEELNLVLSKKPDLRAIVRDGRTRQLLQNPWFLDKAYTVNWSGEAAQNPLNQKKLREMLWRQIVVRENAQQGGIHRKRDRVFREIALRRARSMKSFVSAPDGEEVAVQALLADELLVEDVSTGLVAPAHDVLEDWALVRWVAQEFDSLGKNPQALFEQLGHHLPIRRAYRQWLQECMDEGRLSPMQEFPEAVLSSTQVPSYWKDETVVSLLLSEEASEFISAYEAQLMAHDKAQLKVLIHLLRLACKKPNPLWHLPEHILAETFGDMHLVPEGKAWAPVIELIHRNLCKFDTQDLPYLLGLLEDWKSGFHWQNRQSAGIRETGLIASHFWNVLDDDYRWKKELDRLLEIMLSVAHAIPSEFESIVREAMKDADLQSDHDHRTELVEEKLLASFQGSSACRSHPGLIAEFARKRWRIDQPPPNKPFDDWGRGSDMESQFGLHYSYKLRCFPASALQGPFDTLLGPVNE